MRILHYFLGFHRQGGLNRYAADLAVAQAEAGDEVSMLYPSGSLLPQRFARIHRKRRHCGVRCFSLTGGRIVPLLEGIRDPQMILDPPRILSMRSITKFWEAIRPDVLHIHTWMGFPEEILPVAKANGTKIVYTTHDYFGLCPTVNRLKEDGSICRYGSDQACSMCNRHAPGERYLELRNADTLIRLKSLLLPLKKLLHRNDGAAVKEDAENAVECKPYGVLREHYRDLFRQCDKLHFNSPVTRAVFEAALPGIKGEVLAITHGGIADRRPAAADVHDPVRLAFFGPAKPYKGLPMLLAVLQKLPTEGLRQWRLDIYGCDGENYGSVFYHGFFTGAEEWTILENTDLLIVPSICDETFGFVVEEALCAGVPVLCSDKVGAKMLVDGEWVFSGEKGLEKKMKDLLMNPAILWQEKRKQREEKRFSTIAEHVLAINDFYHV